MLRLKNFLSVLVLTGILVAGGWCVFRVAGCGALPEGWRVAPATQASDPFAGRWEGTWRSSSKPLGGKLTASIEKMPGGDYHASFESETPLGKDKSVCVFRVSERGSAWRFTGKEDLGFLKGGVYQYEGTVDGEMFTCTYDSAFDKGVFEMKRPTAGGK